MVDNSLLSLSRLGFVAWCEGIRGGLYTTKLLDHVCV